jgi:hypothetical protein
MCFVFIWEQTATFATYSINWLVFITKMKSVYSAVRTGSLNKAVCASSLNGFFCVRHYSHFPTTHHGTTTPSGPHLPYYLGFMIPLRHTTLGGTPLDEWSARHRDLYLTTHNTNNRQTFIPSASFEPAIAASERPQTDALNRTANGSARNSCRIP